MEIIALKQTLLALALLLQSCFASPDEFRVGYGHQFSHDGAAWNEGSRVGLNDGDSDIVSVGFVWHLRARRVQVINSMTPLRALMQVQDPPKSETTPPAPEPVSVVQDPAKSAVTSADVIKVAEAIDGMSTGTLVILTVLITIVGVFLLILTWIFREKLKGWIPGRKK